MTYQNIRVLTVLFGAILSPAVGNVLAQSAPADTANRFPDQWALGFDAILTKDASAYGAFEYTCIDYYQDSTIEYSLSPLVLGSMTEIDDQVRYSFKFPVNLALLGLDALATRYLFGLHVSPVKSPLRYVLFAPNSAVNFRMYRGLKLTLATNTEYVFYRLHEGERGILFTPQIGFTLSGGPSTNEFNGIILTIGASRFWNFDGPDKRFRFSFRIGFLVTDLPGT